MEYPRRNTAAVILAAPAYTSRKSNLYAKGLGGEDPIWSKPSRSCSSFMPRRSKVISDGVNQPGIATL